MSPGFNWALRALGLLMIGLCAARNPVAAQSALPDGSRIVTIGGREYVQGELYLESHADTLALAARGFRKFEFLGRAVRSVKYRALWPRTTESQDLPPQVTGITAQPAVGPGAALALLTSAERWELLDALEEQHEDPKPGRNWVLITLPGRMQGSIELSAHELEAELWRLAKLRPGSFDARPRTPKGAEKEHSSMRYAFVAPSQRPLLASMLNSSDYASPYWKPRIGSGPPVTHISKSRGRVQRSGGNIGFYPGIRPLLSGGPVRYSGLGPNRGMGINGPRRLR